MNQEDIKYRQGRSKRQDESNELIAMYGFTGLVIFMLGLVIYYGLFKSL